jgi:hypothetical protein
VSAPGDDPLEGGRGRKSRTLKKLSGLLAHAQSASVPNTVKCFIDFSPSLRVLIAGFPGQVAIALPPHTYLQTSRGTAGARSMMMVWSSLKKGRWKFEVLPGGDGRSSLQYRTFRIDTFEGD